MGDQETPQRFDIPTADRTPLEVFRAMRAYFEKVVAARGEKLDPAWYDDGPQARPELYPETTDGMSGG